MLAQNFKTPADLGITAAEFDALVKVLGMLERGELTHDHWDCPSVPNGFSMIEYITETQCGTVACIAGWADKIADTTFASRHLFNLPRALDELFSGPTRGDASPSQAAIALRNYLTHGEPRWDEALASALRDQ